MSHEYEILRRVQYGEDGATFIPVCPRCGRFVKAAATVRVNGLDEVSEEPNAMCARCGPVTMPFEGYF